MPSLLLVQIPILFSSLFLFPFLINLLHPKLVEYLLASTLNTPSTYTNLDHLHDTHHTTVIMAKTAVHFGAGNIGKSTFPSWCICLL